MANRAVDPPEAGIAIGGAVRRRRQELGLRPEDVAASTKLSISTVHRVERGKDTTLGTLAAIAEALDMTVSELMAAAEAAA